MPRQRNTRKEKKETNKSVDGANEAANNDNASKKKDAATRKLQNTLASNLRRLGFGNKGFGVNVVKEKAAPQSEKAETQAESKSGEADTHVDKDTSPGRGQLSSKGGPSEGDTFRVDYKSKGGKENWVNFDPKSGDIGYDTKGTPEEVNESIQVAVATAAAAGKTEIGYPSDMPDAQKETLMKACEKLGMKCEVDNNLHYADKESETDELKGTLGGDSEGPLAIAAAGRQEDSSNGRQLALTWREIPRADGPEGPAGRAAREAGRPPADGQSASTTPASGDNS